MSKLRAVVDRIENNMAVLLVGDEEYRLVIPLDLLPAGTEEGVVVNIGFELDQTATHEARQRIQNLIDRLSKGES